MKKQFGWLRWLVLPLLVLLSAFLLVLLHSYTQVGRDVLYLTPTFLESQGWDIYTVQDGTPTGHQGKALLDVPPGETFYLSRTWEEGLEGYTFLFLDSDRPASVFVGEELVYSTCPGAGERIGQVRFPEAYPGLTQRGESIRFTLPPEAAGKVLTIATAHPQSEYGPSMPSVRLSGEAVEAELWMGTANQSTMPAAAFAVAAVLLLGLLCYSLIQGNPDGSLLLLTATALVALFTYLRQYSFSSPGFTPLETPLAPFLPTLLLLLPELYLLLQMKRWRKLCGIFLLAAGALSFVPPVANLFGSPSFSTAPFQEALYIGLVALVVFAVLEAREKNKALEIFLWGLGGICLCVLIGWGVALGMGHPFGDFMASLLGQVGSHDPTLLFHWLGIVLFGIASVLSLYQLILRTADTKTALALETARAARLDYELELEKEVYQAKLSSEEELRGLRHDSKGHLITLSALLTDHKEEEAIRYLEDLTQQYQEQKKERFCGNAYVNAVLGTYHGKFQEHQIPFTCQAGVDEEGLPSVELCLILNNALENALEASMQQEEGERAVQLRARVWNGQFLLRVSNRFDGVLQGSASLPASGKKEPGHGYGMGNMRATVERLGGEMHWQIEEGFFVLDIRFPI